MSGYMCKVECLKCGQVTYRKFNDYDEEFDFENDFALLGARDNEFCLNALNPAYDSKHLYKVTPSPEMEEVEDVEHDRVMENMDINYI